MSEELNCLHCRGIVRPDYSEINGGDEWTCALVCGYCGASGPSAGPFERKDLALQGAVDLFKPRRDASAGGPVSRRPTA